jgi:hypothetical protein
VQNGKWHDFLASTFANLKESYPIEMAEFAVTQGIHDEPAFIWWVPYVLAKRKWIDAAVNKQYHK